MVVVLWGLASACVKIPAFEQRDGGTGDGDAGDGGSEGPLVVVDTDATSLFAQGPGYLIRFSGDGSRFPYQFNLGGNFLLGGAQTCGDENGMGIALYPMLVVNGADRPGMGVPEVTTPLTGPYVGQVRISWSQTVSCGATSSLAGDTTFSFFPDGRIARFDRVGNSVELMASNCTACFGGMGSMFYLTSYTTLIADNNAFSTDGDLTGFTTHGAVINPGRSTCLSQRGQSIAFSWGPFDPTRMRVAAESPPAQSRTIAFVRDLHVDTTLPADGVESTTQMKVSSKLACGALESSLQPFSEDDHQLSVNGNPMGAALGDGIFGGLPGQQNGYPVDFPVTLTPAGGAPNLPAGFAVWLYHAPLPQTLTPVHSGNPTSPWYYEQRVGPNSVVFWFDAPLTMGQTITINGS